MFKVVAPVEQTPILEVKFECKACSTLVQIRLYIVDRFVKNGLSFFLLDTKILCEPPIELK